MTTEDFWKAYVGDRSPGQFMYDYGARDPQLCVARHVATLPSVYGIMRRVSWHDSFTGDEHTREQVTSQLHAHLEVTRSLWEEAVSQMPERPWPPVSSTSPEREEEHRHPQRIDLPEEPHLDASADLQRDAGGLPREHSAKEIIPVRSRHLINSALDQSFSIEKSLEKTQPIYHTPEIEAPIGTEVDQDLPDEQRLVRVEEDLQIIRAQVADSIEETSEEIEVSAPMETDEQDVEPAADIEDEASEDEETVLSDRVLDTYEYEDAAESTGHETPPQL